MVMDIPFTEYPSVRMILAEKPNNSLSRWCPVASDSNRELSMGNMISWRSRSSGAVVYDHQDLLYVEIRMQIRCSDKFMATRSSDHFEEHRHLVLIAG